MASSLKPSWQRGTPAELLGNANGPSGSGTVWRRLVLALGWAMNAGYLSDSDESAISTTEDPAEPQRNTRRGTNFRADNGRVDEESYRQMRSISLVLRRRSFLWVAVRLCGNTSVT